MSYASTVDTGQVAPWTIGDDTISAVGAAGTLATANLVFLYAFEVNAQVTIASMRCKMGSTATGTTDMGIYDSGGNLLGHTGAITNTASGTMTNALTAALALSPGQYYMALCPSNNTDTYQRQSAGANLSTNPRCRSATNAGTAGVLPATTGGSTSVATGGGQFPAFCAIQSGGLS